jgi:hypothetical protein
MTLNPHFKDIFLREIFTKKHFNTSAEFNSQLIHTGMYLAAFSFYGIVVVETGLGIHTLNTPDERNAAEGIQRVLGISGITSHPAGELFWIKDVLKSERTIKHWWRTRTVYLYELAPWNFYSKAEQLAEEEGAKGFLNRRKLLDLAIKQVFLVRTRFLRNMPPVSMESEFSHFPSQLERAWDEQVSEQKNAPRASS